MAWIRYVALNIAILALTVGCEGRPSSPANSFKHAKDPLSKVSPFLVILELQTKAGLQTNCIMSEHLAASSGSRDKKSDVADRMIAGMKRDAASRCTLFRNATEKSAPVFQLIRQQGALPAEVFVFSLMKEGEGGTTEQEIGLFATARDCELVEGFARDSEFGTRRCRRWNLP